MLYEVAIVQKPTHKQREEGTPEVLIVPPYCFIATDDRAAAMKATLDNKDKLPTDLALVDVLVRPFV